ncbi:hypothetical protein B0H12DRAFT_1121554 [Mycena haematopus]|nr:hypothetical protein B0H12DRAFT_1121554 [Mycena haematopus]
MRGSNCDTYQNFRSNSTRTLASTTQNHPNFKSRTFGFGAVDLRLLRAKFGARSV